MLDLTFKNIPTFTTKDEILQTILKVGDSISNYYDSIPVDKFFISPDSGWSAKKNIDHLNKSLEPVILGLRVPKFSLLIFGKSKTGSRKINEFINFYLEKIGSGASAGIFTPIEIIPNVSLEAKNSSIQNFKKNLTNFHKVIQRWDENELDEYKMPHPILGNITIREMIYFSIFHIFHHTEILDKKLS